MRLGTVGATLRKDFKKKKLKVKPSPLPNSKFSEYHEKLQSAVGCSVSGVLQLFPKHAQYKQSCVHLYSLWSPL